MIEFIFVTLIVLCMVYIMSCLFTELICAIMGIEFSRTPLSKVWFMFKDLLEFIYESIERKFK